MGLTAFWILQKIRRWFGNNVFGSFKYPCNGWDCVTAHRDRRLVNILFLVSRGKWAGGGGWGVGGRIIYTWKMVENIYNLYSDARVNGPHLQAAPAKTLVLKAKNYFSIVKVKHKMYFHLRKRCPSHEKSLFATVFNFMSLKVKGAHEWSERVGCERGEWERSITSHATSPTIFNSARGWDDLWENKRFTCRKKKKRKTYFGGAVFI